jgi:hypothetical protein
VPRERLIQRRVVDKTTFHHTCHVDSRVTELFANYALLFPQPIERFSYRALLAWRRLEALEQPSEQAAAAPPAKSMAITTMSPTTSPTTSIG